MKTLRGYIENKIHQKTDTVVDEKTVVFVFEKIIRRLFGISGAQSVEVVGYQNKILKLAVKKSVWQTELELQKKSIQESINQELFDSVVEAIYIERR